MNPSFGTSVLNIQSKPLTQCEAEQLSVLQRQKRLTRYPYYSTVKFVAPAAVDPAGAATTYDLARGTIIEAFSYAVGDNKIPAGYTTGDGVATKADTNITTRFQTIGGQNVIIHGIALQWCPAALHLDDGDALPHRVRQPDAAFLAALNEAVSVELTLNADENTFRMGTIGMLPGAGGLMGGSDDIVGDTSLAGNQRSIQYPTNGWPVRSNYFAMPEGLIWRNQSNADSQLKVKFEVTRAIRLFTGGSPEHNIQNVAFDNTPATASTGTGKNFPTEVVAELKVILVGSVLGPRTRSA